MSATQEIPIDPSVEYIGTQLFTQEYRTELEEHLRTKVKEIIPRIAQELQTNKTSIEQLEISLKKQSKTIINDMIADMSSLRVLRMFAFTIKTLLARLYHRGIHVDDKEVAKVSTAN